MTFYISLSEAARLTGRSKATLSQAIKEGRLSFVERTKQGYKLDPAEVTRVYPIPSANEQDSQGETQDRTAETALLRE